MQSICRNGGKDFSLLCPALRQISQDIPQTLDALRTALSLQNPFFP